MAPLRSRRRKSSRREFVRGFRSVFARGAGRHWNRSEEHTSELQSIRHLVCRLLLEKITMRGIRATAWAQEPDGGNIADAFPNALYAEKLYFCNIGLPPGDFAFPIPPHLIM